MVQPTDTEAAGQGLRWVRFQLYHLPNHEGPSSLLGQRPCGVVHLWLITPWTPFLNRTRSTQKAKDRGLQGCISRLRKTKAILPDTNIDEFMWRKPTDWQIKARFRLESAEDAG